VTNTKNTHLKNFKDNAGAILLGAGLLYVLVTQTPIGTWFKNHNDAVKKVEVRAKKIGGMATMIDSF
jgi:hypothetical protein